LQNINYAVKLVKNKKSHIFSYYLSILIVHKQLLYINKFWVKIFSYHKHN